jgi:hypothetical protein
VTIDLPAPDRRFARPRVAFVTPNICGYVDILIDELRAVIARRDSPGVREKPYLS